MRRWSSGLALALLVPVAGCGGSSTDAYCHALRADQRQLAAMIDSTDATALLKNLPLLRALAAQAPPDLVDEWQSFLRPVEGLQRALDSAHVKATDFVDGKPPAGLSAADRASIAGAASQLGGDDAVAGASGIDQEARDVCKLNLGL